MQGLEEECFELCCNIMYPCIYMYSCPDRMEAYGSHSCKTGPSWKVKATNLWSVWGLAAMVSEGMMSHPAFMLGNQWCGEIGWVVFAGICRMLFGFHSQWVLSINIGLWKFQHRPWNSKWDSSFGVIANITCFVSLILKAGMHYARFGEQSTVFLSCVSVKD